MEFLQQFITAVLLLSGGTVCVEAGLSSDSEANKDPLKPKLSKATGQASVLTDMPPPVVMYGCMMGWEQKDVSHTDTEVKHVIQIAVNFLKTEKEGAERKSMELYKKHTVEELKKYRLAYSKDEVTPFSQSAGEGKNDKEDMCLQQNEIHDDNIAYMGFHYKFTLNLGKEKHKFEMSEFVPGDTHIYSHTVDDVDQVICDGQSGDSAQSSELRTVSADCESGEPVCKKVCTHKPKLKILSQNIWNFYNVESTEEEYVRRMKKLGPVLQSAGADIIGFQEIRYQHGSGLELGPCQMNHLYKYLSDYQFVYQPAMTQFRSLKTGRCEEGLAIFSRFPIVSHDFILLHRNKTDPADGHQRICLHAEIDVPAFGKIHVFVTHLSLTDKARSASVVEIYNYMQQFEGPAFFMGDLNAEPFEESIKFLNGEVELKGSKVTDLVDTWLVGHEEGPGGLTFSAVDIEPDKRIDYIYMRKADNIHVDKVELVSSGQQGSGAASDHYGVLATFDREEH